MDHLASFQSFFDACIGTWVTERTYHYLNHQEVERSHTEFTIAAIPTDLKTKVLTDNQYPMPEHLASLPGFHLKFDTVSEAGEQVSQQLNMLFVPQTFEADALKGHYLRDRAYEEAKSIVADFRFDLGHRELLMTTHYTHVVSVDSITLINPQLRIRKILNYRRPVEGQPLQEVLLAGFGVEQKAG